MTDRRDIDARIRAEVVASRGWTDLRREAPLDLHIRAWAITMRGGYFTPPRPYHARLPDRGGLPLFVAPFTTEAPPGLSQQARRRAWEERHR